MEDEIVHIFHRHVSSRGQVLTVHRCDGDDRSNGKIEIKLDGGIIGIAIECVERRGVPHRLTAARVPHQGDTVQIHFAEERIVFVAVEIPPCREVLE